MSGIDQRRPARRGPGPTTWAPARRRPLRRGRIGRPLGASAALAVVAVGLMATAPAAWAHNSRPGFTGTFGPYTVTTELVYVHGTPPEGVSFDLHLRDAGTSDPVEGATVTVTARHDSTTVGPLDATATSNDYNVVIPDEQSPAWDLEVHVSGPHGSSTITGSIPGAGVLRNDISSQVTASPPPVWSWVLPIVALGLVVPAAGFGRRWRTVAAVAGVALLVAAGVVLAGSWSFSPGSSAGFLVAAAPTLVGGAVLIAGLVQLRRRAGTALMLVFVGAAALTVLEGFANLAALTGTEINSTYAPATAQAAIVAVLGLGLGVMLLVVVQNRTALRGLLPGAGSGPAPVPTPPRQPVDR